MHFVHFKKDCALDYKTQYKRLILKHHPDAATFRAIQAEYKTILFFHTDTLPSDSWADLMEEEDIELQIESFTNDILEENKQQDG